MPIKNFDTTIAKPAVFADIAVEYRIAQHTFLHN
jgi:hypothetical protein